MVCAVVAGMVSRSRWNRNGDSSRERRFDTWRFGPIETRGVVNFRIAEKPGVQRHYHQLSEGGSAFRATLVGSRRLPLFCCSEMNYA